MYCAMLVEIETIYKMHSTYTKITETQQTKLHNIYKNTKLKLLKTNAAIWQNKICRTKTT
jgi:archaellum component FlaF (FlaF/FlaG flagellin family)